MVFQSVIKLHKNELHISSWKTCFRLHNFILSILLNEASSSLLGLSSKPLKVKMHTVQDYFLHRTHRLIVNLPRCPGRETAASLAIAKDSQKIVNMSAFTSTPTRLCLLSKTLRYVMHNLHVGRFKPL